MEEDPNHEVRRKTNPARHALTTNQGPVRAQMPSMLPLLKCPSLTDVCCGAL
jgi:hypothetical protein